MPLVGQDAPVADNPPKSLLLGPHGSGGHHVVVSADGGLFEPWQGLGSRERYCDLNISTEGPHPSDNTIQTSDFPSHCTHFTFVVTDYQYPNLL
jgi:hypothetical protein